MRLEDRNTSCAAHWTPHAQLHARLGRAVSEAADHRQHAPAHPCSLATLPGPMPAPSAAQRTVRAGRRRPPDPDAAAPGRAALQRGCGRTQAGHAADERSKKDDDLWSPALRGGGGGGGHLLAAASLPPARPALPYPTPGSEAAFLSHFLPAPGNHPAPAPPWGAGGGASTPRGDPAVATSRHRLALASPSGGGSGGGGGGGGGGGEWPPPTAPSHLGRSLGAQHGAGAAGAHAHVSAHASQAAPAGSALQQGHSLQHSQALAHGPGVHGGQGWAGAAAQHAQGDARAGAGYAAAAGLAAAQRPLQAPPREWAGDRPGVRGAGACAAPAGSPGASRATAASVWGPSAAAGGPAVPQQHAPRPSGALARLSAAGFLLVPAGGAHHQGGAAGQATAAAAAGAAAAQAPRSDAAAGLPQRSPKRRRSRSPDPHRAYGGAAHTGGGASLVGGLGLAPRGELAARGPGSSAAAAADGAQERGAGGAWPEGCDAEYDAETGTWGQRRAPQRGAPAGGPAPGNLEMPQPGMPALRPPRTGQEGW